MAEINLLDEYPKLNRDVDARAKEVTQEDIRIARQFGREFFDGPRIQGYGGYKYDGRWVKIVKKFIEAYGLTPVSSVLDVGCAKGFMLHDFRTVMPGIMVAGIDVSEYAIECAMDDVKPFVRVANAKELPFPDHSFDLVISITTLHNLPLEECKQALREVQRVKKPSGYAFITLDAWRDDVGKDRLQKWVLTALTSMHVDDWKKVFEETGYTGDYYWFMP